MFGQEPPKDDFAVQQIKMTAADMAGWLKFLGIFLIVYGGILCLTLVGIIVAWVPIWMGILLFSAGNHAKDATYMQNTMLIVDMLKKLKIFFIINAIFLIIGIVFFVLAILLGLFGYFSFARHYVS